MDESSLKLSQNILSLLDKLVVGIVAIAASVIAQWSSHKWSKEREQQKVLQEKAADLIKGIHRHQSWTFEKCSRLQRRIPRFDESNPIGEIEVLCRVYFPLLKEERLHFLDSIKCIDSRLLDLLRDPNAPIIPADDEYLGKFLDHYCEASEILMRAAADQVPLK